MTDLRVTAKRLLAQANVARPREPIDSPRLADFVAALDPVNRLADSAPGFVWRLRSEESHGAVLVPDGSVTMFVNVSVWESYAALHDFVYRSPHGAFVRRRSAWFLPTPPPFAVLWWVRADEWPTAEQALARLRHLRAHGPTRQAFTLRRRFEADGRPTPRRSNAVGRTDQPISTWRAS